MNFTESFDQFSSRLTPTDLALYAGVGIALWVVFKDKLSPVQKIVLSVIQKAKELLTKKTATTDSIVSPSISVVPSSTTVATRPSAIDTNTQDIFFKLVLSWKQTRDLAVQSKCIEAVRVADEMFPYLSPNVCQEKKEGSDE